MKKHIVSNPVTAFILITFIFSWTLWLLMILSEKGLLPFRFPVNFAGSFGPAAGALVVTAVINGRKGLSDILKSLFRLKTSGWMYLVSFLLLIIAVYILVSGIVFFIEPAFMKYDTLPGFSEMIVYFMVIAAAGGPLGEEIGWRGFLLPRLLRKNNPFKASLVISFIWLFWHLPLFWLNGSAQHGGSFAYFAMMLIALNFLFTWLYMTSERSLLPVIIFHTFVNYVSAYILPSLLPLTGESKTFGQVSALVLLTVSLFFIAVFYRDYFTGKDLSLSKETAMYHNPAV